MVVAVVVLTEEKSSWEKAESGNSSLVRVLLLRNDDLFLLASFRGGGRLSSFSPSSPAAPIMLLGFCELLSLFSRAASFSKFNTIFSHFESLK